MIVKTLKWPVVALLITGGFHFIIEAVWPALKDLFTAPALAPLTLAFGIWVGTRSVQNGGNLLSAIVNAAILGLLPIVLETVGFGMVLGFGNPARFLIGVYAFSMILFGSLIGSGYAMSAPQSKL